MEINLTFHFFKLLFFVFFLSKSACNLNLLREQMNLMHLVEYRITSSEMIHTALWIASPSIFLTTPLKIFDILLAPSPFRSRFQMLSKREKKYVYHKIELLLSS